MALFRLTKTSIEELPGTSFGVQGVQERTDLQLLLKLNIGVIAPDVLIIGEEFSEWEESTRRIDLLGVDRNANLVVIELKRDHTGGHMELQALRYAAMVSTMTFDRAVDVYQSTLNELGDQSDGRLQILEFLGWDQPHEEEFARETRIILVAADFKKELTTTVLWLNERNLDIRCVRLKPHLHGSEVILDVQQIVPLPEAAEYQDRVREKAIERRESIRHGIEATGYWFMNVGDSVAENRSWEDRKRYGFMSVGGANRIELLKRLTKEDRICAYATGKGYVGIGQVTTDAMPVAEFCLSSGKRLLDMPLATSFMVGSRDTSQEEWCVGVNWLAAVDREQGMLRSRAYRGTLCQFRQQNIVDELLKCFGLDGKQ